MVTGIMGGVLSALLDLVLPQPCLGCGAAGARLCGPCVARLAAPARRLPEPAPEGLPDCWSAAPYAGVLRQAVVAYKERGEAALAAALAELLARTALTATLATTDPTGKPGDRPGGWAGGCVVVPVPSARRAVRGRGHDAVGALAGPVVRRLRAHGVDARLWPVLGQARRVSDQAGLSATERAANLAASLRARLPAGGPPGAPVLLVDDIVTTGSTLTEAARALRAAGLRVPLAVTVGATPRAFPVTAPTRRRVRERFR